MLLTPVSIHELQTKSYVHDWRTLVLDEQLLFKPLLSFHNWDLFKDINKNLLENYFKNRIVNHPSLFGCRINNVRLISNDIVVTRDNHIVMETIPTHVRNASTITYGALHKDPEGKYFLDDSLEPRRLSGSLALLSRYYATAAYGHWLMEVFPKVSLYKLYENKDLRFFFYNSVKTNVSPHSIQDTILQSLKLEQVSLDNLVCAPSPIVELDEILYVSDLGKYSQAAPYVFRYLNSLADNIFARHSSEGPFPERIFVSRSDTNSRRIINEPEISSIAKEYGFSVIMAANLSFIEQILYFRHAKYVCGALGSSMANTVFCRDEIKLLYLLPELFYDKFFLDIAVNKRMQWSEIRGFAVEPILNPYHRSDFYIEPNLFKERMKHFIS
jgi:capsular polysaccharide biosynthesis protein